MKQISETDVAMARNKNSYIDFYDRLKMIAISLFSWEGLDDVAGFGASRFLEQTLYEFGRAVFVKDSRLGYLALRVNPSSTLNVYNLPDKVNAWSIGYSKDYNFDEVVYIQNNLSEIPTDYTVSLFAYKLYDIDRTIDINLNAQKTPVLIEGDTKAMLTLKNLYMQYSGNMPFIFGNKDFGLRDKLNVIKTDAPYLIDKLEIHKHEIWNDCLTFLGINNSNTDKKERQIVDEVNANNDLIAYNLGCFYKTRKQACDLINKKFFNGEEKIKVGLNRDVLSLLDIEENDIIDLEGDDTDGKVYDND